MRHQVEKTFFTPGVTYRLIHRTNEQKKPRESVVRFLDWDGDNVRFDARPTFGTQTFHCSDIIDATVIEPTAPYMNRQVKI